MSIAFTIFFGTRGPAWIAIPFGFAAVACFVWALWPKRKGPETELSAPPSADDLVISFVQCWVQDDVFCVQVKNNGGGAVSDATAEITYCDSRGTPYCVLEGMWRESGGVVLHSWQTEALVLAITTDRRAFFAPTKPPHRLQTGKGFVAVRLHCTLYGHQACSLPPLFLTVNFGERPSIRRVGSLPSGG